MNRKLFTSILASLIFVSLLALMAGAGAVSARSTTGQSRQAGTPLGGGFTFQGYLTDGGSPANGTYDIRFMLFDSKIGGNQVGNVIMVVGVQVTGGRFLAILDFGENVFNGEERWLELGVRVTGSGADYTPLAPRQHLTPAPYTLYAKKVAPNSHDHLGESWTVEGQSLVISGTVGDDVAPLILSNDAFKGFGLQVLKTGSTGIEIRQSGGTALYIGQAGGDGVAVDSATNGMVIRQANIGAMVEEAQTGFGVQSAERGFVIEQASNVGLEVGQATNAGLNIIDGGGAGVYVHNADTGYSVIEAGQTGLTIKHSGGDAVQIETAGAQGLSINYAGLDGVNVVNADGDGFEAVYTGESGLEVGHAGQNGVSVLYAAAAGVRLDQAGQDGFWLGAAGNPSAVYEDKDVNGLEIEGSQGSGIYIGRADRQGVDIYSTGDNGVTVWDSERMGYEVHNAAINGFHVVNAAGDGLAVESAGGSGVTIQSAGVNGVTVFNANTGLYVDAVNFGIGMGNIAVDGITIGRAERNALSISSTGEHGINIESSGLDGLHVTSAGEDGIDVSGAAYAGYFRGDIFVEGGCFGCTILSFAVNASGQELQPGQLVAIQGLQPSAFAGVPALWRVVPADAGEAVVGVVSGRAESQSAGQDGGGASAESLIPGEGAAAPGEYLAVMTYGAVQVRLGAGCLGDAGCLAGIVPGARLAVGTGGLLRPLRIVEVDGVSIAEAAPTLGIVLEAPDEIGVVWVLVNPQ